MTGQGPADVATVPTALALDWILLFLHPLTAATSAGGVWLAVVASLLLLFVLPFLPQPAPAPAARVDPAHCNGCRRCFEDCPYAAITMVPHPDKRIGMELAVVDADLCASCGICAGACPTSSPLRIADELVSGIDMPQWPVGALRQRLRQTLLASGAKRTIVVFGCDRGARVDRLADAEVEVFSLNCVGMLPPTFIEVALRDGAAGVLVSGCSGAACEFRLGQRWTAERLSGQRQPQLRASVPAERWQVAWTDAGDDRALRAALDGLRQRLRDASAVAQAQTQHG